MTRLHIEGHNDWSSRRHDVRWLLVQTDNICGPAITLIVLGFGVEVAWVRKRADGRPSWVPGHLGPYDDWPEVPTESLGREAAP